MAQLVFDDAAAKAVERVYLLPDVVSQRMRTLELLAPRPGEHVLDIGAGPGLLAHDLAMLVGETGRVVALDKAPAMLAMAAKRIAPFPHARCLEGDATNLELPEASFDAAVSTQVYEYVRDMPRALAELHRVLKPGGRALILDTDWRSCVWQASDPKLMDRVLTCWDDHLADPHLPARLAPLLTRAGFTLRRVEVIPMLTPQWQPASFAAGITRMIYGFARENGARHGLGAAELDAFWEDQERLIERGEFFFSLNRYVFQATR